MSSSLFWLDRIEQLANLRSLSLEDLIQSLEMSRGDFERQCIAREGPGLDLIRKITDSFEITIDDFLTGRFDMDWIRAPELAGEFITPGGNGSRFRTSLAVVRGLEKSYGAGLSKNIMRGLKVPHRLLHQPEKPVKLALLCSLLRSARRRGVPTDAFYEIGLSAVDIPENELIRQQLGMTRSPQELFEKFFNETIFHFESNFDYSIRKQTSSSFVVEVTPLEGRIEENGEDVTADHLVSTYRWGVITGMLRCLRGSGCMATAVPLRLPDRRKVTELVELRWHPHQAASLRLLSAGASKRYPNPSQAP